MKAHQTLLVKHSFVFRFTSLLAVFISCFLNVHAQDSQRTRGFYPGASYAVSDIDTVNTKNGNLMLSVPTASLPPGRGGLSAGVGLFYDSKIFDTFTYDDGRHPDGPTTVELVASQDGGWRYGFQYEFQLQNRFHNYSVEHLCLDQEPTYMWKVRMKFPDGNIHVFRPQGYLDGVHDDYFYMRPDGWRSAACQFDWLVYTGTMTYYSADGTYLRLDVQHDGDTNELNNPWTLYLSDGGRVTGGGTSFERIYDRNNNYIEIQNITYNNHPATKIIDQMNRYLILEYGPPVGPYPESGRDYIHAWRNDENGQLTQLTWTIKWRYAGGGNQYYANPNDISIGTTFYSTWVIAVDEIVLPAQSGGLIYKFAYNSDNSPAGWGEVSSVTLPSGAKTKYQFSMDGAQAPYSAIETKDVLINHPTQKDLVYRPEYDLASGVSSTPCNPSTETCITDTWTFSYVGNNSPANAAQTTGPDGGITKDYFQGTIPGMEGNPPFNPVFKSERPDGTMLETLWQLNYPNGCNGNRHGVNPHVKTEFTSIKNATGSYTKTRIKDYNYDKNGNVTRVAEYDWVDYSTVPHDSNGQVTGIPGGAVVKRVTTNGYYNPTPDASNTSYTPSAYNQPSSPQFRQAIQASEVSTNGVNALSRTEYVFDNPSTTANLTQQTSWDSTKGAYSNPLSSSNSISVSTLYNLYGSPTLTTDPRGYQTELYYGPVGSFSDLYPTQVKTPYQTSVQRTETRVYDFRTGLVTSVTDVDNNVSSSTTYDVFGRPTLVNGAQGKPEEARTRTSYDDTLRRVIVRSDLNAVGDEKLANIQHFDQLGRVRLTRQLEDATTQSATDETQGIKVQTRYLYSASNSYVLSSNPYRAATSGTATGEVTMGWTRSKSDNGERLIEVQTFGGADLPAPWGGNTTSTGTVTTAYDANFATVTDQTSKVRRSMINGLGQLVRVDEPDSNGSLGTTDNPAQPTSYAYDALSNLLTVNQGAQTRTFVYSSLARLTSATNPESGTINYTYDANGNLTQKTDARSIVTTYVYDALNRNTTINYSDTTGVNPDITRIYDTATNGKGRLRESYAGGNETVGATVEHTKILSYDALGRPLDQRQRFKTNSVWSAEYQTQRGYNLAGAVTSQTYPSGRTVSYAYDNAGRTSGFIGNLGDGTGRSYSTEIVYSPLGGMTKEKFGTDTPIFNKLFYNSRGHLSEIRESTSYTGPTDTTWNRGAIINHYSNNCWGMCGGSNSTTAMTDNNGNLKKQEVYVPNNDPMTSHTTWWQGYDYDNLNRLQRVHEYTGNQSLDWQQEYVYDRYGNRTIHQTNTWGAGVNKKDFTANAANNNRLGVPGGQTGTMSYDAAGNLATDTYSGAAVTRAYDAENRMTSETQGNNYVAGVYTYNADGQRVRRKVNGVETWQVYGFGGELLAEYAANAAPASPQKEYGYRKGQLLVTAEPSTAETVWVEDSVPAGATPAGSGEGWSWTSSNPPPASGSVAHQANIVAGMHQHYFYNASSTLPVATGEKLFAYVYLDPANLPSEVMLQWNDGSWEHRAYWGANNIGWGVNGTDSRRSMGALPATGGWVRLEVAASQVGLEGHTLNGMAFTLCDGRATWDRAGKSATSWTTANFQWLVTDQLGTPRMVFDKTGALANVKRHDYLPFGEELFAGTGGRTAGQGYVGDNVRQKFTRKERDNETGLDYFLARYYSSTQGRFTSPDEFKGGPDELFVLGSGDGQKQALPYAKITQPGSLNKYSYVYNNPLRFVDPDGHCGTPSGLKPGQVGICVASYIRTKWFMGPGRGDGRDTNGQGGTSRVEVRVAVDVRKGTVTKTDEAMGTSGVGHKSVGFQGSGGSQVSEANKDQGNVYFQISQHGDSKMNLFNGIGTIDNHLNMVVTPDDKVGITPSSTAKDFPSLEVYKYTMDAKGNVTTTLVLAKRETGRSALKKPEQTVQADPR